MRRFLMGALLAGITAVTAVPAVAVKLTPTTAPGGLLANGSDVAMFDVEIVDAMGQRVPTYGPTT